MPQAKVTGLVAISRLSVTHEWLQRNEIYLFMDAETQAAHDKLFAVDTDLLRFATHGTLWNTLSIESARLWWLVVRRVKHGQVSDGVDNHDFRVR